MSILTIIGFKLYQYEDVHVSGHNCDFIYTPYTYTGHEFIAKNESGEYFSIKLFVTYGECGSGWCAASFGNIEITEISSIMIDTIEYFANSHLTIDETKIHDCNYDFCSVDPYGGDLYYPSGGYHVDERFFTSIKELKNNFILSIKYELLDKILNPDRLENLVIFCNKEFKYLGRDTISTKDLLQNF